MLFLLFSIHPPRRKADFQRFLHFVDRRRAFFSIFCISSTDDGHFSAFSAFRRPTTSTFSRFLHFVSRRRAFFRDFCVSSADDEHFSAFFAFRQPTTSVFCIFWLRGWKHIFRRFPLIRGLGKPFFPVFYSSEVSESHFSQFSTHPRSRKAIFPRFPLI